MNLLIAEKANACINPIMNKFDIPAISKKYVTSNNFTELIPILKTKPIMTNKWYVIIDPKLTIKQIKELMSFDNFNILMVDNEKLFKSMKLDLIDEGVNFKTYDNLNPPKEQVIKYILDHINTNDVEVAKYIYNRHDGYLPKIMESIALLGNLAEVTKKDVYKYTYAMNSMWLNDVLLCILGYPLPGKSAKKRAVETLYEFRYGIKYVLSTMKKDISIIRYAFEEINAGRLSLENYKEFESDNKDFKLLSNNRKEKIIDAYNYVSYRRVLKIQYALNHIEPNSFNMYKLIYLVGGNK